MGRRAGPEGLTFDPLLAQGAGFYSYDVQQGVTRGCSRLARYFGMSIEGCKQGFPIETFIAAIHPDDRARVVASIERAVGTGETYDAHYRTLIAPGDGFPVRALGFCFRDEAGKPISFVGSVEADTGEDTDTERRMIVHALSAFRLADRLKKPLARYLLAVVLRDLGVPLDPTLVI